MWCFSSNGLLQSRSGDILYFLATLQRYPFMYHHPTSQNLDHSWAKCQCFLRDSPKKTCPPQKKTRSSDMFVLGLIWIVRFEEFNSTNLKLPNAEVLGDGDMEAWASWPGISEVF